MTEEKKPREEQEAKTDAPAPAEAGAKAAPAAGAKRVRGKDRKNVPVAVAHAPVAANVNEALDVHGNVLADIPFHLPLVLDHVANLPDILLGQVFHLRVR